jgi:hypothetical protein
VVGSILGVTKDVDMVFTRRFDISHMQVLVMNPNLIPQSVNVVICENLYELKFRVELAGESSNPQSMDMDHNGDDRQDNHKELKGAAGGGSGNQGSKHIPSGGAGHAGPIVNAKLGNMNGLGLGQNNGCRVATFVLQVPQDFDEISGTKGAVLESNLVLPVEGGQLGSEPKEEQITTLHSRRFMGEGGFVGG